MSKNNNRTDDKIVASKLPAAPEKEVETKVTVPVETEAAAPETEADVKPDDSDAVNNAADPADAEQRLLVHFTPEVVKSMLPEVTSALKSGRIVTITKADDVKQMNVHVSSFYADRSAVRHIGATYGDALIEILNQPKRAR